MIFPQTNTQFQRKAPGWWVNSWTPHKEWKILSQVTGDWVDLFFTVQMQHNKLMHNVNKYQMKRAIHNSSHINNLTKVTYLFFNYILVYDKNVRSRYAIV